MDRSDRHLVRVVSAHRDGPRFKRRGVVEQRPERFVPNEKHPVQVVCFAFVPAHRWREVDDRRDAALAVHHDTLQAGLVVWSCQQQAYNAPTLGGVEAACSPSLGECSLNTGAKRRGGGAVHGTPRTSASTKPLPESHGATAVSPRSTTSDTPPRVVTSRNPGSRVTLRRCPFPTRVSMVACASPRKPRASSTAATAAGHGRPDSTPPARISSSLTNSGDGGNPERAPSDKPMVAPSAGAVRPTPLTACRAARGSCTRSGVAA